MYFYPVKSFLIILCSLTGLLLGATACRNDISEVSALSYKDTFPLESGENVEMVYSDSAQIQAIMRSPLANRYGGEDPYLVMPKGISVVFFDSVLRPRTKLTAGYAIKREKSALMEARHDVVVVNSIGEQLNTEHLIWDQTRKIIYSDVFVKIKRKDEILYGQGMEADETFDKWIIKKPRGTFYVSMDEQPSDEAAGKPGETTGTSR